MQNNKRFPKSALSFLLVLTLVLQSVLFQATLFADDTITKTTELQVEYTTNPVGIDVTNPRFSWKLESNGNSIMQTSYRVVVSSSEALLASGDYDMWDSDVIKTNDSFGIKYEGKPLEASTRYFWKVIAEVNKGSVDNSSVGYWETGLMGKKIDVWGNAKWIVAPTSTAFEDISTYTIEYDFKIVNEAAGFIFAASDLSNMLMWQFNTFDYRPNAYFRPHRWTNGSPATIVQKDISNVITSDKQGEWYHVVIDVAKTGANTSINTKLGLVGGAMTEIDSRSFTNTTFNLNKIGIRQYPTAGVEKAEFDNVVIKNANGEVVFSEDFNNKNSSEVFTDGTVANGTLYASNVIYTSGTAVMSPYKGKALGAPLLRKSFDVSGEIESARLYATARGYYELSINGQKVGDEYLSPGWTDYRFNLQYQTYDVTDMLKSGTNAMGAMMGNGWYAGNLMGAGGISHYGASGPIRSLLSKLVITYKNGDTEVIDTDNTWKYSPGPIMADDIYNGETYDARKEVPDWNTTLIDDSSWQNVSIAGALPDSVDIYSAIGYGIKQINSLKPIAITEPQPGVYIYDFGQNMVGFPSIKLKGEAGQVIKLRFAEMLNTENANNKTGNGDGPAGTLYLANYRSAKSTDYYTFKGDPNGEVYTPRFTFHGFRYMELTGISEPVALDDIEGIVISSYCDTTGSFETSNSKINQLYSNIVWGMLGNFVGVPTDCPQRDERLGWTGDTQAFARTASYLQNTDLFYQRWLLDLRSWQLTRPGNNYGMVSDVVPAILGGYSNAWGDSAVIVPWQVYQQFGDTNIIKECYESMKAWCDFLNRNSTNYIRSSGGYGDWLAYAGTPSDLTNTLYTAASVKLFAKMAGIIGNTADEAAYMQRFDNIMNAFFARYTGSDGFLTVNTQTPYAVMLYFDLLPQDKIATYAEKLMQLVRDNGWKLNTGFIGVTALAPALANNGFVDTAYRLLEQEQNPSWLYSVVNGATTIWERWNSFTLDSGFGDAGMNSFNHYAYGSIGEWMFSGILGIDRDEANPGFKEFILRPLPGGSLSYAKGSFDSVSGVIESSWKIEDGLFKYDCTVPANTKATLYLPAIDVEDIVSKIPEGATVLGVEGGSIKIALGSGSYSFAVEYNADFGRFTYINVSNPQDIDASIVINGETHPLPFNDIVPSTTKKIEIVSNDPNYEFAYWNGDIVSNYNPLTNIFDGMKISANFKYATNKDEGETATISPENLDGAQAIVNGKALDSDLVLDKGSDVAIDIKAPEGQVMTGWDGELNKLGNPAFIVANGDISPKPILETPMEYFNYALNKPVTVSDTLNVGTTWRPQNLTDGVRTGTGWTSNTYPNRTVNPPVTVDIDLGKNETVSRIVLYPRTDAQSFSEGAHYFPEDYKVYVKADGDADYTLIKDVVGQGETVDPVAYDFSERNVRYVRISVTKTASKHTSDDTFRVQFAEIEVSNLVPFTGKAVTNINITAQDNTKVVMLGETIKLTANIVPANADVKTVTWFIREAAGDSYGVLSDKGEAIVSGNSIDFTALKPGYVEIVAYSDDIFNAVGHYRLRIVDGIMFDVATPTIVGGMAANVKVVFDAETIEDSSALTVELFGQTADVVNGEAIIKIPADKVPSVSVDTPFDVTAYLNGEPVAFGIITVTPASEKIWAVQSAVNDNGVTITFDSAIAGKNGKFVVSLNGQPAEYTFDASANAITVVGASADDTIVIKNVCLKELFPSFYFTFTIVAK